MRFGDMTKTLEELGKPLRNGSARCPFCGSEKLALATCSLGRVMELGRTDHRHVRCGECRAFGPAAIKGSKEAVAVLLFNLRAPSAELASQLDHKEARKLFSARSYRDHRNRRGLSPCVFCGNADVYLYEFGVMNYRIYARCERCGADGPWAVKRKDAKILWNQAHELVKKWGSGFAKMLLPKKASNREEA
jgi:transcription elongation factor Elf1